MKPEKTLNVLVVCPEGALFEGKAHHVACPGEKGVFEVHPQHKPFMSRLIGGLIVIGDSKAFRIRRGICKVGLDSVTAVVELMKPGGRKR